MLFGQKGDLRRAEALQDLDPESIYLCARHAITVILGCPRGAKLWFAILDVVFAGKPPVPVISRWLTCGATSRFVMSGPYHMREKCAAGFGCGKT